MWPSPERVIQIIPEFPTGWLLTRKIAPPWFGITTVRLSTILTARKKPQFGRLAASEVSDYRKAVRIFPRGDAQREIAIGVFASKNRGKSDFRKSPGRAVDNARCAQVAAAIAAGAKFRGPTLPAPPRAPRYPGATLRPNGPARTARRKRPLPAEENRDRAEVPPAAGWAWSGLAKSP